MSEQQDQEPEVFAPGAFDGLDGTEVPLKGPDGQQIGTATVRSDEHGVTWTGRVTDPQWIPRLFNDGGSYIPPTGSFAFSDQKLPVDAEPEATEPFGFRVFYRMGDGWRVWLEQPSVNGRKSRDIVGDRWNGGVAKDVAVAELERFIAEAREALDALRAGREYGT